MARYTWNYDERVFSSLKEVKVALAEMVAVTLERNGVELIYDRTNSKALFEVGITVQLRKH